MRPAAFSKTRVEHQPPPTPPPVKLDVRDPGVGSGSITTPPGYKRFPGPWNAGPAEVSASAAASPRSARQVPPLAVLSPSGKTLSLLGVLSEYPPR